MAGQLGLAGCQGLQAQLVELVWVLGRADLLGQAGGVLRLRARAGQQQRQGQQVAGAQQAYQRLQRVTPTRFWLGATLTSNK